MKILDQQSPPIHVPIGQHLRSRLSLIHPRIGVSYRSLVLDRNYMLLLLLESLSERPYLLRKLCPILCLPEPGYVLADSLPNEVQNPELRMYLMLFMVEIVPEPYGENSRVLITHLTFLP